MVDFSEREGGRMERGREGGGEREDGEREGGRMERGREGE